MRAKVKLRILINQIEKILKQGSTVIRSKASGRMIGELRTSGMTSDYHGLVHWRCHRLPEVETSRITRTNGKETTSNVGDKVNTVFIYLLKTQCKRTVVTKTLVC